jgi:ribosomal protein S20
MKFRVTIKTAIRSYEVEFDLDDETAAQARLGEVVAEISKRFLRKTERAEKPTGAGKTGTATQITGAGGLK